MPPTMRSGIPAARAASIARSVPFSGETRPAATTNRPPSPKGTAETSMPFGITTSTSTPAACQASAFARDTVVKRASVERWAAATTPRSTGGRCSGCTTRPRAPARCRPGSPGRRRYGPSARRSGRRTARARGSSGGLLSGQEREELLPDLVVLERAEERARRRDHARLADPAHLHTEVSGLQHDHRAGRRESIAQQGEDLLGHPFLDLRSPRVVLDRPRELAQADDALARDVADVRRAEEGKEVIRSERIERDVEHRDHLRVALAVRERSQARLLGHQAHEELAVRARDAQIRAGEVRIVEVEVQRLEHLAEGVRDSARLRVEAAGLVVELEAVDRH